MKQDTLMTEPKIRVCCAADDGDGCKRKVEGVSKFLRPFALASCSLIQFMANHRDENHISFQGRGYWPHVSMAWKKFTLQAAIGSFWTS